ncbi:MAG TPA: hypothetical protein PKX28_00705 [Candidatus Hydrogenedentes bacterium]|nr:hypothetical protein [Candidatus Hydrogenedentota bacterium]
MIPRVKTGLLHAGRFLFAAGGGIVVGVGIVATIQTLAMSIPQAGTPKPSLPVRTGSPVTPADLWLPGTTTPGVPLLISSASTDSDPSDPTGQTPALRYAEALMAGDGETAIAMLSWVRDRLNHVQRSQGAGEPVQRERERLAREILDRSPEGAVLREEGIEDQYVFVPGCRLERIGHDGGASGLEAPAAGRDWIRVTYPQPDAAPKSPAGKPYKTLVVGLNWDANGMILKGNVIGNLEIDPKASSR